MVILKSPPKDTLPLLNDVGRRNDGNIEFLHFDKICQEKNRSKVRLSAKYRNIEQIDVQVKLHLCTSNAVSKGNT